jgi:hypothetical protein
MWYRSLLVAVVLLAPAAAVAQSETPPSPAARVIEVRYTPTPRAQVALWIEKADGTFMATIGLTQAVANRGIGNRPGAEQMNSGFHWPYGRREGALPIWAHRRAAAPGAAQFTRVIFQNRSEGDPSSEAEDSSPDNYFCLSFMSIYSQKESLDAVSCASRFSGDKGRYITSADVASGYSEPIGQVETRPLELVSLYPPRRDITRCGTYEPGCPDGPDTDRYAADARAVMPDLDAVSMATAPGDREQSVLFAVPADWPDGGYVAWAEVNTEGDTNGSFTFSMPMWPDWDSWAQLYGYAYRGQPSVAFKVPFAIGVAGAAATTTPEGYGDVNGFGPSGGALNPLDSKITVDPVNAPGSGGDRFRLTEGNDYRMMVVVRGGASAGSGGGDAGNGMTGNGADGGAGAGADDCSVAPPPAVPSDVQLSQVADYHNSDKFGHLRFVVPTSPLPIHHYEVRVSMREIRSDQPTTFAQAVIANAATLADEMLAIPTDGAPGSVVQVDFGHLTPSTQYFLGIRAVNTCAVPGPYAVASFTTTTTHFTKLSGCFVATAAFGSSLAPEVETLRVARDALRRRSELFATAADLYYRSGPVAAALIARSESARTIVRALLAPAIGIARAGLSGSAATISLKRLAR